jgi:hypothetical protein
MMMLRPQPRDAKVKRPAAYRRRPLNTYQRLDAIRFQAELHLDHGALGAQVAEMTTSAPPVPDSPNVGVKPTGPS